MKELKKDIAAKLEGWKKAWMKKLGRSEEDLFLDEETPFEWAEIEQEKASLDVHDSEQRREYVQGCLDQMREATEELELLKTEYDTVTSHLKDMEEIEALPETEMKEVRAGAGRLEDLEEKRGVYLEKKHRLSEVNFHKMERMEKEAEEACRKLGEAEEYQAVIRQDLTRLDAEKHAYQYRKSELKGIIADSRGMVIVCTVALMACYVVLFALRFVLEMDIRLGFLLTTALTAVVTLLLYFKYVDSVRELKKVENGINRIILLQNRVKIRFINNTNLLDYLYMKYQVKSGREFIGMWEKYQVEKEERKVYREAELELEERQQEFMKLLRRYRVEDPGIWLHQTRALMDPKEMVEIRHGLIARRQSLRRRMEYNKDVVTAGAEQDIRKLAADYPEYAREIMDMLQGVFQPSPVQGGSTEEGMAE